MYEKDEFATPEPRPEAEEDVVEDRDQLDEVGREHDV